MHEDRVELCVHQFVSAAPAGAPNTCKDRCRKDDEWMKGGAECRDEGNLLAGEAVCLLLKKASSRSPVSLASL